MGQKKKFSAEVEKMGLSEVKEINRLDTIQFSIQSRPVPANMNKILCLLTAIPTWHAHVGNRMVDQFTILFLHHP
jgi:hypothetical protein